MKKRTVSKQVVIQMPGMGHIANGKFWFFLPVPFMYKKWPFKAGELLLVTVQKARIAKPRL